MVQTILITGASSGIGAGLAEGYAAKGVTLYLTARNQARLDEVAELCRTRGATVTTASIDVRDKAALAEFITRADEATPIDLVIANAGISTGSFSGKETLEAAEQVFAINSDGVIHTIHPLIERMKARRSGHIAIMSSLAGICALPSAPAYSASKAAVRYYGDGLRGMLKPYNVHVSVICPGWISTPLTDKNHFTMPLIMPVSRAVHIIIRGLGRKKSRLAFPVSLYVALRILATLPVFAGDAVLRASSESRRNPSVSNDSVCVDYTYTRVLQAPVPKLQEKSDREKPEVSAVFSTFVVYTKIEWCLCPIR